MEECDDHNLVNSDGCSSQCTVELGWTCPWTSEGTSCARSDCNSVCGDGIRTPDEECDDGNMVIWDGCTPFCVNETVFVGGSADVLCSGNCDCPDFPIASIGSISYERVENTAASACEWLISSGSSIHVKFIELTPVNTALNPWHVYFSTRQRTLLTILTLLRCVICQTPPKTLPIPAFVKALRQAPILQHHFSHHLALICAWIGGMLAV